MQEKTKKELLAEIEEILEKYKADIEIDSYVLKYLDGKELKNIKAKLLKKQEKVIEDNRDWLEQFKKY